MFQIIIKKFSVLFFLISGLGFSQIEYPTKSFKKIMFTYKIATKFKFNSDGLTATNELLRRTFPRRYIGVAKSSDESTKESYLTFKEMTITEKNALSKLLLEYNSIKECTYDVDKKTVFFNKTYAFDHETSKALKQIYTFENEVKVENSNILYKKDNNCEINLTDGSVDYWFGNDKLSNLSETQDMGIFNYSYFTYRFPNQVFFDKKLSKFINPTTLFANCDYGVTKVVSLAFDCNLIKVSYL